MRPEPLQLRLSRGLLHGHRWGAPTRSARPLLCVPGLSANSWSFETLARELASAGREVVALDLRGRGNSPATAAGTYGWQRHAEDVLEAAAALGWERFHCAGHSMGAYVVMQLMALEGSRGPVQKTVLIDAIATPDAASLEIIERGLTRLNREAPSEDEYIAGVRAGGAIRPWHEQWERHYRYELEPTAGGASVRAKTSATAVQEDLAYGRAHDATSFWPLLTSASLVIRATLPLLPEPAGGYVFTAEDAARLRAAMPSARLVEVEANHFGVMTQPQTLQAIREHLDA